MSKNNSMEVESIPLVAQGAASCQPASSFSIMRQVVTKCAIIENDKVDKILKKGKK